MDNHPIECSVGWDIHSFTETDAKEIADEIFDITGTSVALKPTGRYATIVDVLLIISLSYAAVFAKNFFPELGKKLGDKLGEEIAKDAVKVYSGIKKTLLKKLVKNQSEKGFQFLIELKLETLLVRAVISGNPQDIDAVGLGIDSIQQLVETSISVLEESELGEEVIELRVLYNQKNDKWVPLFLSTKSEIYQITSTGNTT